MRPGPDAVTPLALLDVESLSDTGQVDALIALDRQIAWLQARQQRLIASFATRAATEDSRLAALTAARGGPARSADPAGLYFAREDVACALRIAGSTAQDRLDVAAQLTGAECAGSEHSSPHAVASNLLTAYAAMSQLVSPSTTRSRTISPVRGPRRMPSRPWPVA